ncbi:MAG TPA: acyltransferase [Candidatus Binatia bacterium]|nr:acyltransferase [Candidatus Binatia bacterium]
MASTDIAERDRFVVLDGMRGLAALAVITDHVPSEIMRALLPGRYLAVDFFFVLSGFVLAHVYGERLKQGMGLVAFMRVRLVRLYPLYLAAVLISVAMSMLVAMKGWEPYALWQVFTSLAFALLLIPCPPSLSLWPNAPFPLVGPSWSLFFELVINVVFAAVGRFLTSALCLWFMGIGAAALTLATLAGMDIGGHAWSNILGGLLRVTFGFFAGVWLYKLRDRWTAPGLPVWAAFGLLFAAMAMPMPHALRPYWDLTAILFIFPPLVAMSANSSVKGRLLDFCAFVGLVSYGVYVLHVPLFAWVRLALQRAEIYEQMPGAAMVALMAIVALGVTWVLHMVYDVPVRRFLSRRKQRKSRETTGPAPAS